MHVEVAPLIVEWDELHSLLTSAFAYMDSRIDPPSSLSTMTASDLEHKASGETLLTARSHGRLVGCLFCRVEDGWLYVGKMAVAGDAQRMGIGRALIDEATVIARERRLAGLELETRIELTENHETFGRLGFVKIADQSHDGYTRITNIRMRAPLTPTVDVR